MRFNKEPIRDFFVFSQKERSGIIGLTLLLAAVLVAHYAFDKYTFPVPEDVKAELSQYLQDQKRIEQERQEQQIAFVEDSISASNEAKIDFQFPENFILDPNLISDSVLIVTGLSSKLAARISNYRAKGGKFRSKDDLLKIYGMDTTWYIKVEPFITIQNEANSKTHENASKEKWKEKSEFKPIEIQKFNLNLADTLQLKALKGIASYSANKIVNYRNRLGGFLNVDEVDSIWGISDLAKQELKKNCFVTSETIVKISINTATLEELKQHPYISYSVAKVIVAYRDKHGPYIKLEHIKRTDLVDEQLYSKIAPYIKL